MQTEDASGRAVAQDLESGTDAEAGGPVPGAKNAGPDAGLRVRIPNGGLGAVCRWSRQSWVSAGKVPDCACNEVREAGYSRFC
jgi:hypothetical protein